MEKESYLAELKEKYKEAAQKYDLPGFEEMAEEFDIGKAAEKESDFVLREVRRVINDKLSAYLHLFETFMNPSSAPVFVFSMLRNLSEDDRKNIKEIYKKIARIEIEVFKLDTFYNEKSEAKFIQEAVKLWKNLKNEILVLIEKFGKGFDAESSPNSKGYFG